MATSSVPRTPRKQRRTGYRIDLETPHDRMIPHSERNRAARWATALTIAGGSLIVPALFGGAVGLLAGPFVAKAGTLVGLVGGGTLLKKISSRLFVYNPEWNGYVTLNPFSGEMVPYGPGLHPSHVWEERGKSRNYYLGVITKEFTVSVQTKTAQVTAKGQFQYAVDITRMPTFVGVSADAVTIEQSFTAFIESFLTAELADKTAEEARKAVDDMNDRLAKKFMGTKAQVIKGGRQLTVIDFEHKYGIITVSVVLQGFSLSQAAQKTRDAVDEAENLHRVVATLIGVKPEELTAKMTRGEITKEDFKEYLTTAMAASENAVMDIKVLRVENLPVLLEKVFEMFGSKKAG